MYENNMLWQISLSKNFSCTSGEEEKRFSSHFSSSAILKLGMRSSSAGNNSRGYLLHFGWFLFSRNGDGKTSCICATHSGFRLWPHSTAFFDTRLGVGKSVISHVKLGFSQPHLAVEKLSHESLLSQLLRGGKGESPSCLIRRVKLLKGELDP